MNDRSSVQLDKKNTELREQVQVLSQRLEQLKALEEINSRLSESEERYRMIIDQSADAMMTLAPPSWKFTSGNASIIRMFGVNTFSEFTALEPWKLSPERQPDGRLSVEKARDMIETAMRKGSHFFEWVHQRLNGEPFNATVQLTRIEMSGKRFLHATVRDITDRKKAEDDLKRSELFRKRVFESSRLPIVIMDIGTYRFTECNAAAVQAYGFQSKEETIGKTPVDVSAPFQYDGTPSKEKALYYLNEASTKGSVTFEWRHQKPDGKIWDAEVHLLTFEAQNQQLLQFTLVDITERKRVENALRESERMFSTLIDNLPGFCYQCHNDPAWTMLFISSGCQSVTGYSPDELIENKKLSYNDLIHMDFRDKIWTKWQENLAKNEPVEIEYPIMAKGGEIRWVWERGRGVFDSQGQLMFLEGFIADISRRKQSEDEKNKLQVQLLQAQKMESIGRLAGGVAHDFNNMLSIIRGQSEIALKETDPSSKLYERLHQIMNTVERSASLVSQLLAFARKQPIVPQVIDLNNSVADMLQMLRRLIGEDVKLIWEPGVKIKPVSMDPSQISQILVNLCINARDAIENVGKITVKTHESVRTASEVSERPGILPGEYAVLEVSDTGCGMDSNTVGHLFEPFFTTKSVGKGSGLGLATIYGIVRQNNGFIDVSSKPGLGSTFRIHLPVYPGDAVEEPARENSPIDVGGRETILLVEDEKDILEVMTEMLEGLGYSVVQALTPRAAVQMAEEHKNNIHLLITDVIMPEMNGLDLSNAISSIIPDLKTLFMSGYTADIIDHHDVLDRQVRFLQKPFSYQSLAETVRGIIAPNDE